MTSVRVILSTVDDGEAAHRMARQLVESRTAACVNIIPNVSSVYKWKGAIEEAQEYLLIIKTSDQRVSELIEKLTELHPYTVPEILVLPVQRGGVSYIDWVLRETRTQA